MVLAAVFLTAAIPKDLPDSRVTPGAVLPEVTSATVEQTICRHVPGEPSWSRAHRPPEAYTEHLKRRLLAAGGGGRLQDYELDHLVPLSLGGDPTSPQNLWLQPRFGAWDAAKKDRLEVRLWRLACQHPDQLSALQRAIAVNWEDAYRAYCPTEAACPAWSEE
jgi:hypothetical protein